MFVRECIKKLQHCFVSSLTIDVDVSEDVLRSLLTQLLSRLFSARIHRRVKHLLEVNGKRKKSKGIRTTLKRIAFK